MHTAVQRILILLILMVGAGLFCCGRTEAQESLAPGAVAGGPPEVIPLAPADKPAAPPASQAGPIVGEAPNTGDAVFGTVPPGCEMNGGAACTPPQWSIDAGMHLLMRTPPRTCV